MLTAVALIIGFALTVIGGVGGLFLGLWLKRAGKPRGTSDEHTHWGPE